MFTDRIDSTLRKLAISSLLPCAALVTLAAASTPARADGPHFGFSINFVVPTRIVGPAVPDIRPYYLGRVWFAPHHHEHVIYSYPVDTPDGVVYEPYTYCDGVLIRDRIGYVPGYDPRYGDSGVYGRVIFDGPAYVRHGYDRRYWDRRDAWPRYDNRSYDRRYDNRGYDRRYDNRGYDRRYDRRDDRRGHDRDDRRDHDRDDHDRDGRDRDRH